MNRALGQRTRALRFSTLALGLAVASGLPLTGAAFARSLGSLAPPNYGGCTSCEVFQGSTALGQPSYVVPHGNWTITSWRAQGGGTAAGHAKLRIYRPTNVAGQFKLLAESALMTIPKNGHPSFTVSIAVRGGDLLGIQTVDNLPSAYSSGVSGDNSSTVPCGPTVGQRVGAETSCALGVITTELANVKVTLFKH